MKVLNPTVSFDIDYLGELAIQNAKMLPAFEGHELYFCVDFREQEFSGIQVGIVREVENE